MRYKALLSIGLGLGLALGSGAVLAQDAPATDTLTKPLGADDSSKSGDNKNKPATQSKGGAAAGSQKAKFGALDINTDRKLSRDEVKANAALSTDFDKLDADRNGSLTDGEFAKFEESGNKGDKDDKSTKDKAQDERDRGKDRAQQKGDRAEDKLQ